MITSAPTKEMVEQWKKIFDEYHDKLTPNRKSGQEVDEYFREHYNYEAYESKKGHDAVYSSIMQNAVFYEKLNPGKEPEIKTYMVDGSIFVGIDNETGYFQVECENVEKAAEIYDELFLFRGLDKKDIENIYLVAEYVRLSAGKQEKTV